MYIRFPAVSSKSRGTATAPYYRALGEATNCIYMYVYIYVANRSKSRGLARATRALYYEFLLAKGTGMLWVKKHTLDRYSVRCSTYVDRGGRSALRAPTTR
jgi:hypothetical protein